MQYSEVVEKIRNHESVSIHEVNGFQLIMLIHDHEVKNVSYQGNLFEINFIPITYAYEAYVLKEEELSTLRDGEKIIEHWIHCYDANKSIFVQLEDEYFEIIVDVLESAE